MSEAHHLLNLRFHHDAILHDIRQGKAHLKRGSRGNGVLAIQKALYDMGFNLKSYDWQGRQRGGPDGIFGQQTQVAVRNFQEHARSFYEDMVADGVIGPLTMEALDELAPTPGSQAWEVNQPTRWPHAHWQGETPVRVVVVKAEHRTFLFDHKGLPQAIYSNATGKAGHRTDVGLKMIRTKIDEKGAQDAGKHLWHNPHVFGSRILDLSWADGSHSGEELHGTSRPDQMGMNVSAGCIRHYNDDIIALYDALSVGDKVAVVDRIRDPNLSPLPSQIS